MYSKIAATTGIGALAFTGASLLYVGLAAFALVAGGMALARVAPRSEA